MLYVWLLLKTKLISSVLMNRLPVSHNNNNDGIEQFLSHKLLSEKLAEAHSLGFQVRWLEGSWPEQQHQLTSDIPPSSHQWGSQLSARPDQTITQCINALLP